MGGHATLKRTYMQIHTQDFKAERGELLGEGGGAAKTGESEGDEYEQSIILIGTDDHFKNISSGEEMCLC